MKSDIAFCTRCVSCSPIAPAAGAIQTLLAYDAEDEFVDSVGNTPAMPAGLC